MAQRKKLSETSMRVKKMIISRTEKFRAKQDEFAKKGKRIRIKLKKRKKPMKKNKPVTNRPARRTEVKKG